MTASLPAAKGAGRYRVVRRLRAGGMAETFVATRTGPGGFKQDVCLKRILPAFGEDREFVRLFLEEARLAASLRHSNIVGVLDFGRDERSYFLALELVDGMDLRELLASLPGKRLDSHLVVLVATELAHALDHAHGKRVVHRDVSPSNVLVSSAGEVKLADFGIAKAAQATTVTASVCIKGKVQYMAPEQIQGLPLDGRADLFSLGVIMYEALTGRRPFDGGSEVQTMARILAGEREPLASVRPDTPPALAEAVERALESDPTRRFGGAAALLDALTRFTPPTQARRELGELVRRARSHATHRDAELVRGPTHALPDTPTRTHHTPMSPQRSSAAAGDRTLREATARAPSSPREAVAAEPLRVAAHASTAKQGLGVRPADSQATDVISVSVLSAHPARRRLPAAVAVGVGLTTIAVASAWWWDVAASAARDDTGAVAGRHMSAAEADRPSSLQFSAGLARGAPAAARDGVAEGGGRTRSLLAGHSDGLLATTSRGKAVGTAPVGSAQSPAAPSLALGNDGAGSGQEAAQLARVRVMVRPWGMVWVDGRYIGRAPIETRLSPGVHRFSGGLDSPVQHRTFRVPPGGDSYVEIMLPDQ